MSHPCASVRARARASMCVRALFCNEILEHGITTKSHLCDYFYLFERYIKSIIINNGNILLSLFFIFSFFFFYYIYLLCFFLTYLYTFLIFHKLKLYTQFIFNNLTRSLPRSSWKNPVPFFQHAFLLYNMSHTFTCVYIYIYIYIYIYMCVYI